MDGLMMDRQLLIKRLLWRAEHVFGDAGVLTRLNDGSYDTCSYAELASRVRTLASVLLGLGVRPGDPVLTLAWNSRAHLEAYFAVPGIGAVLHTGNHRLSAEQLAYTVNHAGDRVAIVDADLLPLLESIADSLATLETIIVLGDVPVGSAFARVHSYDQLMTAAAPVAELPELNETTAAGLCFTSGTTGDPKGVLYSHRSTVLHALALCTTDGPAVSSTERFLLMTPMSHVNGWGVPYASALAGATLILPGCHPKADDLIAVIEAQRPTTAVGAVTVAAILRHACSSRSRRPRLDSLRRVWVGGQAPSAAEVEWWAETYDATVVNGWGMTETSPMATFNAGRQAGADEQHHSAVDQGPPLPLVELRIVDELGTELPWDGERAGELEARAPWVAAAYFDHAGDDATHHDGWLRTGDVSVIDEHGSLLLKDRTKDLIKSGGEWISSVELENALIGHPAVREAAVVAVADPTWIERPVACVATDAEVSDEELAAFLAARFPRFWIPDAYIRLDEIPKTSVGKFDKKRIRAEMSAGSRTRPDPADMASGT